MSIRQIRFIAFASLVLVLALPGAPASAHGGDDHCGGSASSTPGYGHGEYGYPGDSLTPVAASGTLLIQQDSLHHMPLYTLDTDGDGTADYWLHFGPAWYRPDSISFPIHGSTISVNGGLISRTTTPGILVITLNGQTWIDTTGSYDRGYHHGSGFGCSDSTHFGYDTLRQVQEHGRFMIVPDTLFGLDQYYLDSDSNGVADFWLHLGHPGGAPAGRTLPADGQWITVTGALMPHGTPPGIMVLTIDGVLWRDSTWTGGHGGGWVGRHGGHIGTANGSWCLFPDSAFGRRMGGHMGDHRWSDSVYCEIDTSLAGHWNGGTAVGYRFRVDGSDGRPRMGHGHGGMMNFNLPVTISLRYREGFFMDESRLRLWKSDGQDWTLAPDATLDTETNSITTEENPLYQYYVIAAASPTNVHPAPDAASFRIETAYPNPFRSSTRVSFTLERPMPVRLSVYTLGGQLLRTLVDDSRTAGMHTVRFHAANMPSGMYLLRMDTPAGSVVHRLHHVR